MHVRFALVQMHIGTDIGDNLNRISGYVAAAKRRNADVVVFPEICVTGRRKFSLKRDGNGRYRDYFTALAKGNGIDIAAGSVIEEVGKRLYNVAYYIDAKGKVLARYAKRNLWLSERADRTPGTSPAVFDTRYGRVGLLICWDIVRPEFFGEMAREGAEIAVCPSYWWHARKRGVDGNFMTSLLATRAFENEMIIVYCNAAGRDRERELVGRSQVVVPGTLRKTVLPHNSEGMLIAEVDTSSVKKAERIYGLRS